MSGPPEAPEPSRPRLSIWAVVPVALGLSLLLGGAVVGSVVVSRRPQPSVAGSAKVVPAVPALRAPGAPPPRLALPSAALDEHDRVTLPASPQGERSRSGEAGGLLPITPAAPIWGSTDALVTLNLFGDLECPHTRRTLRSLVRMASQFGDRVRLVYSHRPLAERPLALEAARAVAGLTLRSPEVSWRALTEAAGGIEAPESAEVARWFSRAGVDTDPRVLAASAEARARVDEDRLLAVALDVQMTPTLFVNGRRLVGEIPDAMLEAAIEREARAVRWLRAEGVSSDDGYSRRVRRNLIGLESGAPDRACVPLDDAPTLGPADAAVTIVEFSDFECSHCRALQPLLASAMARYPGQLRRVWRSLVLSQHDAGERAASFALAARALSGERAFWAAHGALGRITDGNFDDERLRAVARKIGLDGARLLEAAADPDRLRTLARDRDLAEKLGVEGAPTLFVNGRQITGAVPAAAFEAVLKEELAAAQRITRTDRALAGASALQSILCGG